jgi:hypothetical protein
MLLSFFNFLRFLLLLPPLLLLLSVAFFIHNLFSIFLNI